MVTLWSVQAPSPDVPPISIWVWPVLKPADWLAVGCSTTGILSVTKNVASLTVAGLAVARLEGGGVEPRLVRGECSLSTLRAHEHGSAGNLE